MNKLRHCHPMYTTENAFAGTAHARRETWANFSHIFEIADQDLPIH